MTDEERLLEAEQISELMRVRFALDGREVTAEECVNGLVKQRDDARELAAMYLQCLNSRSLERGETVEQVAAFCRQEFEENPWLKDEYEKLANREAAVRSFCQEAKLIR